MDVAVSLVLISKEMVEHIYRIEPKWIISSEAIDISSFIQFLIYFALYFGSNTI